MAKKASTAKKKVASKTSASSGKDTEKKETPAKTVKKVKKSPKKAASPDRPFANEEIGQAAGEVWHALSESPGLTISNLKKKVNAPGDLVTAAVGWLAREDKLAFEHSGRTVKVSLHD